MNKTLYAKRDIIVFIAINIYDTSKCCVKVVYEENTGLIIKPADRQKSIIKYKFKFSGLKKIAFTAIMSNLYHSNIIPADQTTCANPDNEYYYDLPTSKIDKIVSIIKRTIEGITISYDNASYEFSEISEEEILKTKKEIQNNLIKLSDFSMISFDTSKKTMVFNVLKF